MAKIYEINTSDSAHETAVDLYTTDLMAAEGIDILQEGDLFAYISGDASPEIIAYIESSPEHQQKVAAMRKTSYSFINLFADVKPLDPQDLVDVAAEQATANQRLIVDAHCRRDPAVAAKLTELQASWQKMIEQEIKADKAPVSLLEYLLSKAAGGVLAAGLREWVAVPSLAVANVRADSREIRATQTAPQIYDVPELQANMTLRIVPPRQGIWQLKGYITQDNESVAGAEVALHSDELSPVLQTTNDTGFFSFTSLEEGTYDMYIKLAEDIINIPEVELIDDEDDLFL